MVLKSQFSGRGMTSIRAREKLVIRLQEQGITDPRVLQAFQQTPRHVFVDEALANRAYDDTALPIGHHQTLSQPYSVAKMSELVLAVEPKKVLEIGTGSGFQTAILAPFVEQLITIERILPLLKKAHQRCRSLGIDNVRFFHSDGHLGHTAEGPFDAILSAAAASEIPDDLVQQLAPGGRLLLPIHQDQTSEEQVLLQLDHTPNGFVKTVLETVKFVPMLKGVTQTAQSEKLDNSGIVS